MTNEEIVVAVAHGTRNPQGQRAIARLIKSLDDALPHSTVIPAYVDVQTPKYSTVLARLAEFNINKIPVRIVPLLLSRGYHTQHDLVEHLGLVPQATIAPTLGPDPLIAELVVNNLIRAGVRAHDRIILGCTGSSALAGAEDCEEMARLVTEKLGIEVSAAYLTAASPELMNLPAQLRRHPGGAPRGRIVVANYLLADGYFNRQLRRCGADVITEPLLTSHPDSSRYADSSFDDSSSVPGELIEVAVARAISHTADSAAISA